MIEVTFDKLATDPETYQQVVWLKSLEGEQACPLPIGGAEALSIYLSVTGKDTPLPLEHDLTGAILNRLNARVSQVNIGELRDGAVYAELVMVFGEGELRVEVCPGDSIALALKYGAPIYISERVMEQGPSLVETAAAENEGWIESMDEIPQLELSDDELESMELEEDGEIETLDEDIEPDWSFEGISIEIESFLSEIGLDSTGDWDASENLTILRGRLKEAVKMEDYEDARR
jgi:bifunctional DNase/RNase